MQGLDLHRFRRPDAAPNNLPHALTSFVGREREVADVREALAGTRLLTLTGAGGCGKTRLALRVAGDVLERFPGGAWWVELAALSDPELVGPALANAIGVRPLGDQSDLDAAVARTSRDAGRWSRSTTASTCSTRRRRLPRRCCVGAPP